MLGAGGTEAEIFSAMPRSRSFIEYAKGPRAAALLAVTPDWWGQPGVVRVRYEDCVRDPDQVLQRIEAAIGPVRCGSRSAAIAGCSLGQLRAIAINNHFWKGEPGLWRQLLPAGEAGEIAAAIASVFDCLGYSRDPDSGLDALAADRNWVRMVGGELKQTLRQSTEGHRAALRAKDNRIAELDRHCDELTQRLRESVTLSGPIARAMKLMWNRFKRGR